MIVQIIDRFRKKADTRHKLRLARHGRGVRTSLSFLLAGILVSLFSCSVSNPGGGSDVGNGIITGKVLTSGGAAAQDVRVSLVASSFNPAAGSFDSAALTGLTDCHGNYSFTVRPGRYNVFAVRNADRTRCSAWDIAVGATGVQLRVDTLRIPGTVTVKVSDSISARGGFVYVPGSNIIAPIPQGSTSVTLDSVPSGVLPSVIIADNRGADTAVVRYAVPVSAGSTVAVKQPAWKHACRLVLNTSASGAGVSGVVTGFPVLVQLTTANFNFAEAATHGTDLKFTKRNDSLLPFEIERWDPASGRGEIWVKTDTILGNNDSQYIMMYWGNPNAAAGSNGSAVFDTGNGFTGVWHLAEAPSGSGSIKDRTVNGFDGTPLGSFSASDLVDGVIGKGLRFNGTNDAICIGKQVPSGPVFTLEAWVYVNTLNQFQRFIYNQHGYTLWYDIDKVGVRMEYLNNSAVWRGIPQDGGAVQPITTGTWYYLASVYDGDRARLYINGTLATESGSIASTPNVSTDSLLFGSFQHTHYLNGVMDEIRIENRSRSGDWVRLCYMNQKTNSQLVEFEQ